MIVSLAVQNCTAVYFGEFFQPHENDGRESSNQDNGTSNDLSGKEDVEFARIFEPTDGAKTCGKNVQVGKEKL